MIKKVFKADSGALLAEYEYKSSTLLDGVRAGGRIPLIIGRGLTDETREILKLESSNVFIRPDVAEKATKDSPWHKKWWEEPVEFMELDLEYIVNPECLLSGVKTQPDQ